MKKRYLLSCLFGLAAIGLLINSCKKETQNNIQGLFTNGEWQMASIQVFHYVGAVQIGLTDTLNVNCNETQILKFNADNTCTYTNFDCQPNTISTGHWSLTPNQLFLNSDMVCQESVATRDSTAAGNDTTNLTSTTGIVSIKPFSTARIVNLGQYSLVLQTGDLQTFYPPTQKRTVVQYGFVRQKSQ